MTLWVKSLLGTFTYHIKCLFKSSPISSLNQVASNAHPGRQQMKAQVRTSPPPRKKTQRELRVPGFSLAQHRLMKAFGYRWKISLCFYHSAFQISECVLKSTHCSQPQKLRHTHQWLDHFRPLLKYQQVQGFQSLFLWNLSVH